MELFPLLVTGAMRVPSPAAGMMTTTFMAGDKYTVTPEGSSNRCVEARVRVPG